MTTAEPSPMPWAKAARVLRVRVPPPKEVVKKTLVPPKSWRTLRVGQWLTPKDVLYHAGKRYGPGSRWEVVSLSVMGVSLKILDDSEDVPLIPVRNPEWKNYWDRLRKSNKKRSP